VLDRCALTAFESALLRPPAIRVATAAR
jgi:hypothetical protein